MISHYIATGLGGAVGAITRIYLGKTLPSTILGIPFNIMCVNILGCLIMGLLTELMTLHWSIPDNTKYFLVSGFLGGFTTFSTFALEFGLLFEKQEYISAIIYATLSFTLSIIFFFTGIKIIRLFS